MNMDLMKKKGKEISFKMKISIFITVCVCLTSCIKPNVCTSFHNLADTKCLGDNQCTVDLKELFNFKWDSIVIVDPWIYEDEIKNRIQIDGKFDLTLDGQRRYIIVNDGKIVQNYVDGCRDYLRSNYYNGISVITWEHSIFKVKRDDGIYTLIDIE